MSNSIVHCDVIELADLVIPNWPNDYEIKHGPNNFVRIDFDESDGIRGKFTQDGHIVIEALSFYAAGSGHAFIAFKKILEQSTGRLDMVIVWENDHVIQRLKSIDGKVTIRGYDLVELVNAHDQINGAKAVE